MSEVQPSLKCPDCGAHMDLARGCADVFWCSPCKRARVKEHMEKCVAPVEAVRAKFKRVLAEPLPQRIK